MNTNLLYNIDLIGICILIGLLIVVTCYFIFCSYNKHTIMLDKFTLSSSDKSSNANYNYGEGHSSGETDLDLNTLNGNIVLRPCQVYFVGKEQQKICDDDNNENKTCKYEFTDEWKEIDHITDEQGKPNYYPKKIYNQNHIDNDIINYNEIAQCFKKFDNKTDIRFIYKNNDLLKYKYGGTSNADTIKLNYFDDTYQTYNEGDFISMTFNKKKEPKDNYKNMIDSICSKKIISPIGLEPNLIFYKFILNKDNKIIKIKKAELNSDMKSFDTKDINMKQFLKSNAITLNYSLINNKFTLTRDSIINPELVDIYKFKYNYLCNNEESGVIKEYKIGIFTNKK